MITVTIKKTYVANDCMGGPITHKKGERFIINTGNRGKYGPILIEDGLVIKQGMGLDYLIPSEYLTITRSTLPDEYLSKRKSLKLALNRIISVFERYYSDVIPQKEKDALIKHIEKQLCKLKNTKGVKRNGYSNFRGVE